MNKTKLLAVAATLGVSVLAVQAAGASGFGFGPFHVSSGPHPAVFAGPYYWGGPYAPYGYGPYAYGPHAYGPYAYGPYAYGPYAAVPPAWRAPMPGPGAPPQAPADQGQTQPVQPEQTPQKS